MTCLKQAVSSVSSQIIAWNARHIAFILLLNSLQVLKLIVRMTWFLNTTRFIFTFFFVGSAGSLDSIVALSQNSRYLWLYLLIFSRQSCKLFAVRPTFETSKLSPVLFYARHCCWCVAKQCIYLNKHHVNSIPHCIIKSRWNATVKWLDLMLITAGLSTEQSK